MFQSTRPRGTRHNSLKGVSRDGKVSIHASARDATFSVSDLKPSKQFQSTRPRGTRHTIIPCKGSPSGFNPRVREGRDLTRVRTR